MGGRRRSGRIQGLTLAHSWAKSLVDARSSMGPQLSYDMHTCARAGADSRATGEKAEAVARLATITWVVRIIAHRNASEEDIWEEASKTFLVPGALPLCYQYTAGEWTSRTQLEREHGEQRERLQRCK